MSKFFFILIVSVLTSFSKPKINYSIEIYVLSDAKSTVKNGLVTEFEIKDYDLPVLPFVRDDDIDYYDTSNNKIYITKDAAKRIAALKPKLNVGIPFVLTVDRKVILTGYFWNTFSSFGCASYVLFNSNDTIQDLLKGLPEYSYVNSIIEKRKNYFFIQALERTGRIK